MDIKKEKYWIRLEREETGSWLEVVANILLPRANHPQYQEKLYGMLSSTVSAFWPGWEVVTYMEKTAHDEVLKREAESKDLQ